jgi:hypothetical protein
LGRSSLSHPPGRSLRQARHSLSSRLWKKSKTGIFFIFFLFFFYFFL